MLQVTEFIIYLQVFITYLREAGQVTKFLSVSGALDKKSRGAPDVSVSPLMPHVINQMNLQFDGS